MASLYYIHPAVNRDRDFAWSLIRGSNWPSLIKAGPRVNALTIRDGEQARMRITESRAVGQTWASDWHPGEYLSMHIRVGSHFVFVFHCNGNICSYMSLVLCFPLCGEFTGHRWIPLTKASDVELWCFLWSAPEPAVGQTMETLMIWDAIMLIMTPL